MIGVLEALDRQYDVLAARGEVPPWGFSRERIGFAVVLGVDGRVLRVRDLRSPDAAARARVLSVPQSVRRTTDLTPNLFWDKTGYALGRTALERGAGREHEAFLASHRSVTSTLEDPVFGAFKAFLERWTSLQLDALEPPEGFLDANVVFEQEGIEGFLHEQPAVAAIALGRAQTAAAPQACLVTGRVGSVARLHPVIKGVAGAPTSGAMLVSFNADSACSRDRRQGDNAPIVEETAFRYGAALNRMLEPGSQHRLRTLLGDATVLCWPHSAHPVDQQARDAAIADLAGALDDAPTQDAMSELALMLDGQAAGGGEVGQTHPLESLQLNVLALSPNAGRLWVRSWSTLGWRQLLARLEEHRADAALEPAPWARPPALASLLRLSVGVGADRAVSPHLAARAVRALLNGEPYPQSWLSEALNRMRRGDSAGAGWTVAAIKAVQARRLRLGRSIHPAPAALDQGLDEPGYAWGRLFALWESAQRRAVGRTSLRRRFFGAASLGPARVYPTLLRGATAHLATLGRRRRRAWLDAQIGDVSALMPSGPPRTLSVDQQGSFFIGHYHQQGEVFRVLREQAAETDESD